MRKFGRDFRIFALGLAVAAGIPPFLQADQGPGSVIAAVTVSVDGEPAGDDIAALVAVKPGIPYSEKDINAAVKQIFKSGLFSDVQVLKEVPGPAEVRLTFLLTRILRVRAISILAEKGVSTKKLKEGLYGLREDGEYTPDKLRRAVEELTEALKQDGYLKAKVEAKPTRSAERPDMDVVFNVNAGRRVVISRIGIAGDLALPESDLKKQIQSRIDRPFVPALLDADLGRLRDFYRARGYPRAEILLDRREFLDQNETVALTLNIIPHERIRITIQGADVPEDIVRPIWEERIFEDWGLLQSEMRVLSYLRSRGYVFATAKSSLEKESGELRIIHDVNPGRTYQIYDIAFEGLRSFTDAEMRRELSVNLGNPLFGGLDGQKLYDLPAQIARLYETRGFLETRVDLDFRRIGNEMRAIYAIDEGPQQTIERLSLEGALHFSTDRLRQQIISRAGGPYFQPYVQRDIERLETFYLNEGLRGTSVSASVEKTGDRSFAVVFHIAEGRRVKIERIIVTGNAITRRSTIDRELRIAEGDWALAEKILESRRGLEKLGIFSEVKIEEIPVTPVAEHLVINLREGERIYVGAGVGLETANEPQNLAVWNNTLRLRGTAEFIMGNMFGRASQFSFVLQSSIKESRAVASWEGRYLFGMPLQTTLNAWLEREERVSYGYDQRGVSFTGITLLGQDWVSLTTLRWASTTLYFLNVAESEVDRQHFPFSTTAISQSLIRDRRDDSFNPETGYFFSAVFDWAYPLFKAESDYLKLFLKYQRYVPVFRTMNLSVTARAGAGLGRMPIHERFFAGGSNSFRGQPFDRLGPTDPVSGEPIGGKAMLLFNVELRFPLFEISPALSGAVFYDKGNVFSNRSDFKLGGMEDAFGVGVRYRTPLGPLRIDLGWNVAPPEGRKQPIVFITIGNVF